MSVAVTSTAVAGALAAPRPELVPSAVAAFVFYRHLNLVADLMAAHLENLDAVRSKLARLEARARIQDSMGAAAGMSDAVTPPDHTAIANLKIAS